MDDDDFRLSDVDDTMRNLEKLAHSPSEIRFRLSLVYALKDLRRELRANTKAVLERIERAEKTIIGPGKVAHIVKTEMKDDQRVGKLETDVKRLWWLVGVILVALVSLVISRALK